jgi:septum formation protein
LSGPVILASSSPRRRELLAGLGVAFEVAAPEVCEDPLDNEPANEQALRLARAKAEVIANRHAGRLVLAADTVVSTHDGPLGKPVDRDDARRMLALLSGRTHEVVTAVAVAHRSDDRESTMPRVLVDLERTRVTFRVLSEAEVEAYLSTPEPYDKAGAYGAQGMGAAFIERVDGCFFNVVGLPVVRVVHVVRAFHGAARRR